MGKLLSTWQPFTGDTLDLRPSFRTVSVLTVRMLLHTLSCVSAAHLLLSTAGADVNSQDVNGNTPLHIAARCGHELIINTLLANRADASR